MTDDSGQRAKSSREEFGSLVRNFWIVAAVVLLLTGIALQRAVPAAVGALVLLTGLVAVAWSRLSLERIAFERNWSQSRAFVGEELEATFVLRNRKALPLPWFEVRVTLPEQLPQVGIRHLPAAYEGAWYYRHTTSLSWYERVSWRQRFQCTSRGFYAIGPTRLRSGDIFGFFPRESSLEPRESLHILPRIIELGELDLPRRRPFGEGKGGSPIFEDQSRMAGVRDYRPGDPLKRIDWKATARRGALQSRLFDPSSAISLIVALNVDTYAHTWEGYDPLLLERSVSVAASVAALGEAQRFSVGLLANSGYPGADLPIRVPAGRDPAQLTRVLEALAMIQPFTITTLEDLLDRERRRFPVGTSVAVVAAFLTEALARKLERLQEEGLSLALYWTGEQPPQADTSNLNVFDLAPRLREFERSDPIAYGGETVAGYRATRRAIRV